MTAIQPLAALIRTRARRVLPAHPVVCGGRGPAAALSSVPHRLAACAVFAFVAAALGKTAVPLAIDWHTSPLDLDLRGMNGEQYTFHCPPGKPSAARITGSGPYTDASSICTAAVHAGALRARDGGDVTIVVRPGQARYPASERNAVLSNAYDARWSGSFDVLAATPASTRPAGERP